MEATQQCATFLILLPRPWLLVGTLLVGRNTEEVTILLVADQVLGAKASSVFCPPCRVPPCRFAASRHTWSDRRTTNSPMTRLCLPSVVEPSPPQYLILDSHARCISLSSLRPPLLEALTRFSLSLQYIT